MWKDYSFEYVKKNKAVSISIMIAVFVAALFISMLSSLFYNMWKDDIRRVIEKDGDWQARITKKLSEPEIQKIRIYSNAEQVIVLSDPPVTEVYFKEISEVYNDMPDIARMLNISETSIEYHRDLLTKYFIFSPEEKKDPPLIVFFYLFILILVCFSLVLIIKNAFRFSMNSRIHQLGILKSIGAAPKQLRTVLLQEAFILSVVPALLGTVLGIVLCIGFLEYGNTITEQLQITKSVFEYHYLLFLFTIGCSFVTVFLSAWLPARKLSRITPLQAIRGDTETYKGKMKKFRLTSAVFGMEGELSRKSLYTRRKAFRTATVCLTVSFLVLTFFLNFMTISEISVGHTFVERYKDAWDIMIEIKNPSGNDTDFINRLRNIDGVSDCSAYQKSTAYTVIGEDAMSEEVKKLGGYHTLNSSAKKITDNGYWAEVQTVILDDNSFFRYAGSIGIQEINPEYPQTVLINTIWDSIGSKFYSAKYIPFLTEKTGMKMTLYPEKGGFDGGVNRDGTGAEITVAAYSETVPNLREEYNKYGVVQIMPLTAYQRISNSIPLKEKTMYINIQTDSDAGIGEIEKKAVSMLGSNYDYMVENRPDAEKRNIEIYDYYRKIIGAVCVLLACIGIANVFANTLGFVFQRKREFARYQSIGLTPNGIMKMFGVEMLIIGVKPILLSIPFNAVFILFAVNRSGVEISEFMERLPVFSTVAFTCFVLLAIGISYFIGSKQIKQTNITDALKNDALF